MAVTNIPDPLSTPHLVVNRKEAEERIKSQIEKGRQIVALPINSQEDLEKAVAEKYKWSMLNIELLKRFFSDTSIADEYRPYFLSKQIPADADYVWWAEDLKTEVRIRVNRLESILERLEYIPESESSSALHDVKPPLSRDVFIVHGHDAAAKESVARLVEKLGLGALILHEQPNAGRTIIEKIEDYSNVGFAIVLLTPDDVGGSRDKRNELKPRARQNVILELGYFMGKLGRGRVRVLYKEDVEIPSDYRGVLYIPMDPGGAWQMSPVVDRIHRGRCRGEQPLAPTKVS